MYRVGADVAERSGGETALGRKIYHKGKLEEISSS
jgi:hypothetical protein